MITMKNNESHNNKKNKAREKYDKIKIQNVFLQFHLSKQSFELCRMWFYYFLETLLQNNFGQIEIICYDEYWMMEAFLEANF